MPMFASEMPYLPKQGDQFRSRAILREVAEIDRVFLIDPVDDAKA